MCINRIKMSDTLRKFYYLLDEKKYKFIFFIIFYFFLAAIELFVIAVIYYFISLLTDIGIDNTSFLSTFLSNFNFFNLSLLNSISILLIFLVIFKNVYQYILNNFFYFFSYNFQVELKDKILRKISKSFNNKTSHFDKNEIQKTIIFSTERYVVNAMQPIMMATSDIFLFFMLIFFLGAQELKAMIFLSGIIIFCFVIFAIYFKKKYIFWGEKYNFTLKKIIENTENSIESLDELKLLNNDDFFTKVIKKFSMDHAFFASKYKIFQKIPRQTLEIIVILLLVFLVIFSKIFFNNENILLSLSIFGAVSIRLIPAFSSILVMINEIKFSKSSIDELFIFFKNKTLDIKQKSANKKTLEKNFQSIQLKNIKYSYNKNNTLFKNLNINIKKKDFIGICGSSGSGKSTILKILATLHFNFDNGNYMYNNKRVSNADVNNLREKVYYLSQSPFILEDSIEANVALGLKKSDFDSKKIKDSLQKANCDFIKGLKNKEKSLIKANGRNLSQGQKQRLSIARALYYDREILLLDEITSNLDINNQNKIIKLLKKLSKTKTIILVSHDINVIKSCNKKFKLQNGTLKNLNLNEISK